MRPGDFVTGDTITKLSGATSQGSGNSMRNYPNPAHGPFRGAQNGTSQNIFYVDGHLEHHNDPFNTRPHRAGLPLRF